MVITVALPIPINKQFSYSVPLEWADCIKEYSRVKVPFHNRVITGYITGVEKKETAELKELIEVLDPLPLIDKGCASLCGWASRYYITSMGVALKSAIPPDILLDRYLNIKEAEEGFAFLEGIDLKKAEKKIKRPLLFRHFYEGRFKLYDRLTGMPFEPFVETQMAFEAKEHTIYMGDIDSRLKYYLTAIERHIKENRNVVMLLPEHCEQGHPFYEALIREFNGRVYQYSSYIKPKERLEVIFRARGKTGQLFLGNRSCIFLPVRDLSLIIVERAEEEGYRNEKGFRFNAAMVAKHRAEMEDTGIIFGSACPPLDIVRLAEEGRFNIIEKGWLNRYRYKKVYFRRRMGLSMLWIDRLLDMVDKTIKEGGVVAIYTPRKDYGIHIRCVDCRRPVICPECNGTLRYQKEGGLLSCLNCGTTIPSENGCLNCGSRLIYPGYVGVEYLEECLKRRFGAKVVQRITGETVKGVKDRTKVDENVICPTVFIGTHSLSKCYGIRAKRLIIVGWEELFRVVGFKAEERLLQIVVNIIDALKPEEVDLFTDRDHRFAFFEDQDLRRLCRAELKKRREANYPPWTRLFLIKISGKDEKRWLTTIDKVEGQLKAAGLIEKIIGPLIVRHKGNLLWRAFLKGNEAMFYEPLIGLSNIPGITIEPDPPTL